MKSCIGQTPSSTECVSKMHMHGDQRPAQMTTHLPRFARRDVTSAIDRLRMHEHVSHVINLRLSLISICKYLLQLTSSNNVDLLLKVSSNFRRRRRSTLKQRLCRPTINENLLFTIKW